MENIWSEIRNDFGDENEIIQIDATFMKKLLSWFSIT